MVQLRKRMYETHPGHWNDDYNDVFIDLRDGQWTVSERMPGNENVRWATVDTFPRAERLALRLANGR